LLTRCLLPVVVAVSRWRISWWNDSKRTGNLWNGIHIYFTCIPY